MKTYKDFIKENIINKETGKPIYLADIAKGLAAEFDIPLAKAQAATSVAIKRLIDNNEIPCLRAYQKGIYYITAITPFGETKIDKESIIRDKYVKDGNGYEYGPYALYKLGLSTQLPNQREIVCNNAYECRRKDKKLDVWIKPPRAVITDDNKAYLMILDVIDVMEKYPVDAENPYKLIAEHINRNNLKYDKLLALSDKHYNAGTTVKLAHVAGESGVYDETA